MNIEFITHYYLSDKEPFQSLSALDGDVENPAFQKMLHRHANDPKYNRRYGLSYLETRLGVEAKLRDLFIQRGGKPSTNYPAYFVLGESRWFEALNEEHQKIQIRASDLPLDKVSITFPDSYLAMTARMKPYFEDVCLINEIDSFVKRYGNPLDVVPSSYENYWEGDFEHYYEVQIWDNEFLKPYSRRASS